ncbi:unnamed protein product [Effrenium voratum]|nr:unnamed protein product [Effrenium voratum]
MSPHGQQTARLGGELRLEGPDLIWKLRLRGRALVARKVGPVEPRLLLTMRSWKEEDIATKSDRWMQVASHADGDCITLSAALLWATQSLPATSRFTFGEQLGQGQSGCVHLVTDTESCGQKLIAKVAEPGCELIHEAMVLKSLQGLGFPECLGIFAGPCGEFLVAERLGASLDDWQKEGDGRLEVEAVARVASQVLAQLAALHSRNLAHGDLKPKNLLIKDADTLEVCLIDFGCCRPYRISDDMVVPRHGAPCVGTTRFCAIAAHKGERSPRCDLESLAYVLIHLATGRLPWQGIRTHRKLDHSAEILSKKMDFDLLKRHVLDSLPDAFATGLLCLVEKCRSLQSVDTGTYCELHMLLTQESPRTQRGYSRSSGIC